MELLLAVPARRPAVEKGVIIAGTSLRQRILRQTFEVNKARAVPATGAPPHELSTVFSLEANVTPVTIIFFQFFRQE